MAHPPADDEGFARRWSRLKHASRDETPAPADPAAAPERARDAPAAAQPEKKKDVTADLPPIESLTRDSDYTGFLRPGVPEALKRAALRKLWRSDPLFGQIDFTEAHSIDFNAVETFPDGIKSTLYRVGKGMIEAVEELEREEARRRQASEPVAQDEPAALPEPSRDATGPSDPADDAAAAPKPPSRTKT